MEETPTPKQTLVLLDTHAILHRAFHAIQGLSSADGMPTGALYGLIMMILKISQELNPEYIVACLDLPEETHRHAAFAAYKATRSKTDPALIAQISVAEKLLNTLGIPTYSVPGFEADDMLGTITEQLKGRSDVRTIIASGDMDTLQLVEGDSVQVYTLRKGMQDTVLYNEAAVLERFGFSPTHIPDYKGLRGDPSDNIPGIAGIGEKTATELITRFDSLDTLYKTLAEHEEAFAEAGIKPRIVGLLRAGEAEARFSKELATIRRDAPITFALPDAPWRESLTEEGIRTVCDTYSFRSLRPRLEAAMHGGGKHEPEESAEAIDPDQLAETALALWLLNSDITNPSYADIIAYGREHGVEPRFEAVRERILKDLAASGMEPLYRGLELPLRGVLQRMEARGIALDTAYLAEQSKRLHAELSELESAIHTHAGAPFNINSPKQLGVVLFEQLGLGGSRGKKTSTGQRTTKEAELAKLRDAHPIIPLILRHRELQKLLSTYIDSLPQLVGEDGRIHTHFMQAGTTTGRLASRDPNMQNIPMRSDEGRAIRDAFVAANGFELVAVDYAQIELRIAAFLSGDKELIDIFKRGEDIHTGVARRVFGVAEDEITYDMRRRAKIINFGILYGMGVNALRENLGAGTTREEAQEFLERYFHTFARLAEYLEEVKAFAYKNRYTETYFTRRRYFPTIRAAVPYLRASAERMAINAPIQGTEADVVRFAMVHIDEWIRREHLEEDVHMVLSVHDELVFEIRRERIDEVLPRITEIMQTIIPLEETKGVPLAVHVERGTRWGSLE